MKWIEPVDFPVPPDITTELGGHSIVIQALVERCFHHRLDQIQGLSQSQIEDEVRRVRAFLDPACYQPCSFIELPGMELAIERLVGAIHKQEPILIWGDFDVDGQTSTALLSSALRSLGAQVDTYIPDRLKESHGINLPKLQHFLEKGFRLVLTCDTGISALEPVDLANDQNVDVIITDHHDLPPILPKALAVINPRLLPANHPLSSLPGVGVAYELIVGLLHKFGREQEKLEYLDLVALGIIADLAIIKGDARYLLQLGIQQLRLSRRPGLRAIFERVELDPSGLTEDHVGFLIAPRLNALGRLADANIGVNLLTTQDLPTARIMALQLEALNTRRRFMTSNVFQGALAQIRAAPEILEQPVIILDNPSWPSGVIGIVASRLVERYGKPVLLITSGEDEIGRGSARSVEGINITNVLSQVSELLLTYGGHPMAAGFSLPFSRIPEFRKAVIRRVQPLAKSEASLKIDGYLSFSSLDIGLVEDIERLAPFGPGNPPLTLVCRNLRIKNHTILGREEEHLSIRVVEEETGNSQRVIWWQGAGWALPEGVFDLAYRVRSQNVRGNTEILVEWVDFRLVNQDAETVTLSRWKPKIVDYRNEPHPLTMLQLILAKGDYLIWAEGESVKKLVTSGIASKARNELGPVENLIIWTIPPGPQEFQAVVKACVPQRIYVFGYQLERDNPHDFITRLSGLVKYVIKHNQGMVSLEHLAAATAQRVSSVKRGLEWLASQGAITVKFEEKQEMVLIEVGSASKEKIEQRAWEQVVGILTETEAFRNYFLKADLQILISMMDAMFESG
jgi:single-stranded-DNA-specific exonuclease